MTKIFFSALFVLGLLGNYTYAQSVEQTNQTLLTNGASKIWRLTDVIINGDRLTDTDSTCFYQMKYTFNANGTMTTDIPCATENSLSRLAALPPGSDAFSLSANTLTFNGFTVTITNITSGYFETLYMATVSGTDPLVQIPIVQKYAYP